MKQVLFLSVFLSAFSGLAQPINYQGKLSDKSGSPVNGTKNFSLKIFDDKTGGKQIYEEAIGQTAVKEGLYSFNFGEAGKSVSTATETIGFADGEKQIFNYTVKNKPVLGEIKIIGGGYSWTEAGSSDATKFTATANKNSGAISAIYLTGAPEEGEQVSISYDHNSDGVKGALSRGGQAWLELTVDGEALSPRERLVAVPFALRARVAEKIENAPKQVLYHNNLSFYSHGGQANFSTIDLNAKPTFRNRFYIPKSTNNLIVKVIFNELKIGYYENNRLKNVELKDYKHPISFKINNSEKFLSKGETQLKFDNFEKGWSELTVHFKKPAPAQTLINGSLDIVVLGH